MVAYRQLRMLLLMFWYATVNWSAGIHPSLRVQGSPQLQTAACGTAVGYWAS